MRQTLCVMPAAAAAAAVMIERWTGRWMMDVKLNVLHPVASLLPC